MNKEKGKIKKNFKLFLSWFFLGFNKNRKRTSFASINYAIRNWNTKYFKFITSGNRKCGIRNTSRTSCEFFRPKNMSVCGYPTDPAKKYRSYTFLEDLFRNFYVSLGTATSRIFLQKIQRFANSVPFNMTEMV